MIDQFGRNIDYLRLSLTERCTLKCAYCRAGEGACPKKTELSADALLRIVRAAARLGITKVRLTGGEPMLRRDLIEIVEGIRAVDGIAEIDMTTNGQHLAGQARALKEAGLTRLNVSLDSLRPARYAALTGGGSLEKVLNGIEEALSVGMTPLKINAVLLRGSNDDEVDDFIALTKDRALHVRFIELMPMGQTDQTDRRVTTDELLDARPYLVPVEPYYSGQPSSDYHVAGYRGRVGFISPMSHRFCEKCSRVRVMSDGSLRPCLGVNHETSLLDALQESDEALERVMREAIYQKPQTHGFDNAFHADKNMSRIGG